MAVGDQAVAAGFPIVPNTGEEGRVRWGAQEINRTRDFVAQIKALIPAVWSVAAGGTGVTTIAALRAALGLTGTHTISTSNPSGGNDGDVWFKYTA